MIYLVSNDFRSSEVGEDDVQVGEQGEADEDSMAEFIVDDGRYAHST